MPRDPASHTVNTGGGCPSKAMILSAGQGTRLRPLTDQIPKCMVPLRGKPILEHILAWLGRYGVSEVVINLCHFPQKVQDYFGDGRNWGMRITYSLEEKPLGTAGGVKRAARFFDAPFYVWYGDNVSTCRLDWLYQFHRSKRGIATLALHYRDDPTQSGIVDVDEQGRIRRFLEKPRSDQVFSHWVNAGILVLELSVLNYIPEEGHPDFGRDVFPAMLAAGQPLYGHQLSPGENLLWVDTPADLRRAQQEMEGEVRQPKLDAR